MVAVLPPAGFRAYRGRRRQRACAHGAGPDFVVGTLARSAARFKVAPGGRPGGPPFARGRAGSAVVGYGIPNGASAVAAAARWASAKRA
ncbi:Hypothetical protein CINCED_3A011189 [Cinara cedri]|uniref:Uncharacterized protein n=1 Tax=Cinara cedri TaxID=506608 RepID=A0A5E4MSI6_9HEMI|nr:Hypothetical protein CINCED_3A011189 [Cinara cedri]